MKKYGKYYATIGLEIHIALKTESKLFSRSANSFESDFFALLDAGTPGVLPVLSDTPVKMAVAFALSTEAEIREYSEFERKHYFYPDLPLGYQITQQNKPIMVGGTVPIQTEEGKKLVQIEHAHLECDAAKSIHDKYNQYTAIDLARCASPLLEVVSTPCMHSPEEAKEYAKTVHALAMFLDICDGKMEEGSFRVDASISLHTEIGKLGTRVENKNISSFGFLEAALKYEIERQTEILDSGNAVVMETRLFDETTMTTKSMRLKETVDEYRYMPDPDIPPLCIDEIFIAKISSTYPIHYFSLKEKLAKIFEEYKIEVDTTYISQLLSSQYKNLWFDIADKKVSVSEILLRLVGYWLPDVLSKVSSERILSWEEIDLIIMKGYQAKEAKEIMIKWLTSTQEMKNCLPQFIDKEELSTIIDNILINYKEQIIKYQNGEIKMLQFLIGKVMAEVKGKSQAQDVKIAVEGKLKK